MPRKKKQQIRMGPLWDWSKGVTQSSLSLFASCREQFYLGYIEGWTKKGFQTALEFGTMFHLMLERVRNSSSPEEVAAEVCNSYEKARKPAHTKEDYEEMQLTLVKAQCVFPLYVEYYREADSKREWLKEEEVFKIPHKFAMPAADGRSRACEVILNGVRDGDYRTPLKKILGVFETKTKSQISDPAIQDGLRADLQTMLYLLSAQRQYKETPGEVLYNVIRRPGLLLRKNDDYKMYYERVRADILDRPEWYFRRYEVTVLPEDIQTFIDTTLDPLLRCMIQWWESIEKNPSDRWLSPYHYRNLAALETKYGMAPLYDLMIRGKVREYFQRSSPFPELEGCSSLQETA